MIIQISHYVVVCNTCDWSLCWFGKDPWADRVVCPDHPGEMSVPGRNREGDPVRYRQRVIQYVGQVEKEHAYGGVQIASCPH